MAAVTASASAMNTGTSAVRTELANRSILVPDRDVSRSGSTVKTVKWPTYPWKSSSREALTLVDWPLAS